MTDESTNSNTVFKVESSELDYIEKKLEKINKRAKKIGCEPIVLTKLGEAEEHGEEIDDFGGLSVKTRKMVTIDIRGEPPKIAGWEFVATVEPAEEVNEGEEPINIINKMPGITYDVPVEYRHTSMFVCDHCHTKRQRNEIFVIRHETGEFKVVGRQCIKDFMGYHANPNELVRMAQDYANFIGEVRCGIGGGAGEEVCKLDEFLFRTAYFVQKEGYFKSGGFDDYGMMRIPTKEVVWNTFWIPHNRLKPETKRDDPYFGFFYNLDGTVPATFGMTRNPKHGKKTMTEQEYNEAREYYEAAKKYLCETLLARDEDDLNDYLYNLKTIMQMRYIKRQHAGYAASIIRVYQKHLGEEEERQKRMTSAFQGVVGQKIKIPDVKLVNVRGFDSAYGWSEILTFSDRAGNYYKWFTNTRAKVNINLGDVVAIEATVKKHEEYNGAKSTVITRAKIIPVEEV